MTSLRGRLGTVALAAVPAGFALAFFAWPLLAILARGLAPEGALDLSPLLDVLRSDRLRGVAWFTTWQAAASTALTLVVAAPVTWLLARHDFRGRPLVEALVAVPFVLPTTVVGTAFLTLLGPAGPLGLDLVGSVWAILLAHVFFNVAVVVRVVGGLLAQLDPRLVEAARTLGATPREAVRRVTLPLVLPAVWSAAAVVFLFTFTSLGVVLILGGTRLSTLEVEVLRLTRDLLDLPTAAALAVLQLLAVVAALVAAGRAQARAARRQSLAVGDRARRPLSAPGGRAAALASLVVAVLLWGAPLWSLLRRALTDADGWTLRWFGALLQADRTSTLTVAPWRSVLTTVGVGFVATTMALVLGGIAAWLVARRSGRGSTALDALLTLPLGTSAATLGFGFLIALDRPPLDLRSSVLLVPIAHALVATPFVVRVLVPVLRSVDASLREAGLTLGAGPARVVREIELPLVARPAAVAAAFAFAVSAGEFGATVFIARPDVPTVPVAILRLLSRPGAASVGTAAALSVVLLALVGAAVLLGERYGRPGRRGRDRQHAPEAARVGGTVG